VLLNFEIKREQNATVTLVDVRGRPIPAGAQIVAVATGETAVVGWEGLAYLTGLADYTLFEVRWHGASCRFGVYYPVTTELLPELGEHVCTP
jgi:outer membrane usher protein